MAVTTKEISQITEGLEQIFNKSPKLDGKYEGGAQSMSLTLATPLDRQQIKSFAALLEQVPPHLDVQVKRSGAGQSIFIQ